MTWLTTCSYLVKVCSMLLLVSFAVIEVRHTLLCAAYFVGFYGLWLLDGYLVSCYAATHRLYKEVGSKAFDDNFNLDAMHHMSVKSFVLALAARTVMPFYWMQIVIALAIAWQMIVN